MANRIKIDEQKCKLCGGCVSVCPVKIIVMYEDKLKILDGCIHCEKCIKFCPVGAISEV